ncbi:MAG: hypothetical protein RID22_14920 [Roseibium aggregatum]|mgnify:CR=1 FL=1|uniref:hypothetical protein n=1 Tax=uncultured Roseibium sp. TaxID=1936171 RepID=UPI00262C132B|nr:hypothetical protein [uncultured Roseibium sp.]
MKTLAVKSLLLVASTDLLAGRVSPDQVASLSERQPGFLTVSSGASTCAGNEETGLNEGPPGTKARAWTGDLPEHAKAESPDTKFVPANSNASDCG